MLSSLNSGVSGIQQMQLRMDVIGNNIANVNTTGYKLSRTQFEDAFSQTMGGPDRQIGTGVVTASVRNQFRQGTVTSTGTDTHMAISGEGFFMVRNPQDGASFATRDGTFHVDDTGYLVNEQGFRVQGFSDSGLTTRGDIQIDATGAPATAAPGATVSSYSFSTNGTVSVRLSDGTEYSRGQVLLQSFRNPQALTKEGGNLYSGIAGAGALAQTEAPLTNGMGKIQAGALEMSNVDLTNEFANLITTQRAFQANARIITTGDEILQEVVNLKR